VARLSASATAHRLVARDSMHCSGRYSGAGVFSALPVGQQRAQVDIGQTSGILQLKHAPTARPSASAPAQHLVARDSMHSSGSHSGWSKRAAPGRARTWVQCAAFPALPCDRAPHESATARRSVRTDAHLSRSFPDVGRCMRTRPHCMARLATFIILCTIAIPAVAKKSSVPCKPRWLPSRQGWNVPVSLEGRSGATHHSRNPGTHTLHNRSLGPQPDSPFGPLCPSCPQIGMTLSSRRSSALFPLPDLSLWQRAPSDTDSLAADQSYLCGFLASHNFGVWPPSAPLDPLGATEAWRSERDRFERYDTVICTNDQRRMRVNIWDINYNRCPGHQFCSGWTNVAVNAISSALHLHNSNMENLLTTEVLNSLTAFLTDPGYLSLPESRLSRRHEIIFGDMKCCFRRHEMPFGDMKKVLAS